jgi:putative ABC transport system permease protein
MKTQIKLALRVLGRRKFFTFISLFGITLTLVVLMVATAMLDDAFTPSKPESRFDRVLEVKRIELVGPTGRMSTNVGYGLIRDHVATLPDIERTTAFTSPEKSAVYLGADRFEFRVKRADANYWKVLDFQFLEGRPFTDNEEQSGARVAVISEETRAQLFDGKPAVGRTFELNGEQYRVIGVVPNVSVTRTSAWSDVWMPVTTLKSSEWQHGLMGGFTGLVLARDSADFPRLKREFNSRVSRIPLPDPKNFNEIRTGLDTPFESVARDFFGGPLGKNMTGSAPTVLRLVLLTVAVLFMALPALNLVTLNLSRMMERVSEIGVRKAFGAPRSALVSQFVFENIVLTVIGAMCAFVVSIAALAAINASGVMVHSQFDANWRVFGYGIVIAIFFGAFSGLYPAWRISRLDPVKALRGGAQ